MRLVIETQDYENYNAHNGFDGTYYWKAKGGDTFVVELGNEHDVFNDTADICSILAQINEIFGIERDDDYYRTHIIDTDVIGDNEKTHIEDRDDEYDYEFGTSDVRYWPRVLDIDNKTCTMKFRGFDGKLYLRKWVYEDGKVVNFTEEEI